jgi:hypothetical protein
MIQWTPKRYDSYINFDTTGPRQTSLHDRLKFVVRSEERVHRALWCEEESYEDSTLATYHGVNPQPVLIPQQATFLPQKS